MRVWLILAGALLLTGCDSTAGNPSATPTPKNTPSTADTPAPETRDLMLSFDDLSPVVSVQQARNHGSAEVSIGEASFTGAMLALDIDRDGGQAIRFPVVGALPAVVTVSSEDFLDVLNPGPSDFSFGADIKLDRKVIAMQRRGLAGKDNGNNVFQRGLFTDASQYKLQVDDGFASCLLRGAGGQAIVGVQAPVPRETWTRLSCTRSGDRLTIAQEVLEGDATGAFDTAEATVAVGVVDTSSVGPAAIGGKVNADGEPVRVDSDQFNGVIDNVFYDRRASPR